MLIGELFLLEDKILFGLHFNLQVNQKGLMNFLFLLNLEQLIQHQPHTFRAYTFIWVR